MCEANFHKPAEEAKYQFPEDIKPRKLSLTQNKSCYANFSFCICSYLIKLYISRSDIKEQYLFFQQNLMLQVFH